MKICGKQKTRKYVYLQLIIKVSDLKGFRPLNGRIYINNPFFNVI